MYKIAAFGGQKSKVARCGVFYVIYMHKNETFGEQSEKKLHVAVLLQNYCTTKLLYSNVQLIYLAGVTYRCTEALYFICLNSR